jgi:hypothetical protein
VTQDQIKNSVHNALAPVIDKAVHPEGYRRDGSKVYGPIRHHDPLAARTRLATRLVLLTALKEAEAALMKSILEDTESIHDAKAAP